MPWSEPTEYLRTDVRQEDGGRAVIRFAGDFDIVSQRLAARALGQILPGTQRVALDFSRVTFFDAAGIRFVLAAQQQADGAGCDLRLRHPSRAVRRMLALAGALHLVRLEQRGRVVPSVPLSRRTLTFCNSVVDAALRSSGADMGQVQLRNPATGALHIVAERGLRRPFLTFFETVYDGESACGAALLAGQPVWVPDVAASDIYRGTPSLDVMRQAGARAVASVPVLSRDGRVIAMVSAHCRRPTEWAGERQARLAAVARAAQQALTRSAVTRSAGEWG